MRAINSTPRTLSLVAIAGASLMAVACGSREVTGVHAQTLAGGAPIAISCQPNERAVVSPAQVNGTIVSQVECVAGTAPALVPRTVAAPAAAPAGYLPYPAQAPVATAPLEDTRVVPAAYPVRTVESREVVRQPVEVERSGRTWKKSAVIIGSSAGIGAGVGAAMGGKKGALIGAAIGGGGAAIWDQVTRQKK